MKKFQIISAIFFGVGLLSKFTSLPFANLEMLIGCLLFLVHNTIFAIRFYKSDLTTTLLNLTYTVFSISILFKLLHWTLGNLILNILVLLFIPVLTLTSFLVISFKQNNNFKLYQALVLVYAIFCLSVVLFK